MVSTPGQGAAFLRFVAVEAELKVKNEELKADAAAEPAVEQGEAHLEQMAAPARFAPVAGHPTLNAQLLTRNAHPRVLVVEDEPDLREYLRQLLAPAYEVLVAADGQEALEVLSREAPVDLITPDAMMPRLSGTELTAKLKADP